MKRTAILTRLMALLPALLLSAAAWAAPDAVPSARWKPARAIGVVQEVKDGEVVLLVPSNAQQRASILRLSPVEGVPYTPGQVGVYRGEVYARYTLGSEALLKEAERARGKAVILELAPDHRVVGLSHAR